LIAVVRDGGGASCAEEPFPDGLVNVRDVRRRRKGLAMPGPQGKS
jgi:hypothetical protein